VHVKTLGILAQGKQALALLRAERTGLNLFASSEFLLRLFEFEQMHPAIMTKAVNYSIYLRDVVLVGKSRSERQPSTEAKKFQMCCNPFLSFTELTSGSQVDQIRSRRIPVITGLGGRHEVQAHYHAVACSYRFVCCSRFRKRLWSRPVLSP
jgi:hypothetical protein